MYAALRSCRIPPPKVSARHGREYTARAAFSREGEITAPPRVTYSSHDALVEVRDIDRDAAFTLRLADRQLGKPTLSRRAHRSVVRSRQHPG